VSKKLYWHGKGNFFHASHKKRNLLLITFKFSILQGKSGVVSEQQLSCPRHLTLGAELR